MGFFDDFVDVVKDIGTSTTRIITDTAIDLANVTTGFEFDDEMEKAKKAMSHAGINTASEAIERNHYGFLKDMEKEARDKNDQLAQLYKQGEAYSDELNSLTDQFTIMVDDLDILSRQMDDYEQILKKYEHYPAWYQSIQKNHIDIIPLSKISEYNNNWQKAGEGIATSGLIANGVNALTGLSGIAAAARAARLVKASRMASAAKFTKFASVAGKASLVLTIASVGLDIGLSVVQLEDRKDKLNAYLKEVGQEIKRANKELDDVKTRIEESQALIDSLLKTAGLKELSEWGSWFDRQQANIAKARDRMIDFSACLERAEIIVDNHRDYSEARLISLISDTEPQLPEDLIKQIIARVKTREDESVA